MKKDANIPYKIYLSENEIPKERYNVRAQIKNQAGTSVKSGNTSANDSR